MLHSNSGSSGGSEKMLISSLSLTSPGSETGILQATIIDFLGGGLTFAA